MSLTAPFPLPHTNTPALEPRRRSIRKRLWQTVICLSAIWTLLIGRDIHDRWIDPSPKLSLGHDLLPSYAAGLLAREGRPRDMFDREKISAVEFRIIDQANLNIDGRYGPWLNPPFYAWAFAPLSMLPYRQAAAIFLIFNLIAFAISLLLLWKMMVGRQLEIADAGSEVLRRTGSDVAEPGFSEYLRTAVTNIANPRTFLLALLLVLLPLPFWQAMGHQQNTFISLFLLTSAIACWHRGHGFGAGLIGGLLFFKPQLAVVFAALLVIGLGWRALAGLVVTGFALLAITLFTMPGCLYDFLHRLPPLLHWLQMELPYSWGRQITFQSFWRLLIQGHMRGETSSAVKVLWWISSGTVGMALGFAAWRFFTGSRDPIARDRLIAAGLVSMPVLMPYYMDYDLLLLAIPAALLAREWMQYPMHRTTRSDRWLVLTWLAFCLESHFNPGLASEFHAGKWILAHLPSGVHFDHLAQLHLNLAVPMIFVLSLLHISRCLRRA